MTVSAKKLKVHSQAFDHHDHIPPLYTCEGENINPPLNFDGIPENAVSLALIMEDPDAPGGTFDHWLLWNIATDKNIAEQTEPGVSGLNSFGKTGYGGPCPPSGSHRYFFKIYALDTKLQLTEGATKKALLEAMEGHVLAEGELMGYYQKRKT